MKNLFVIVDIYGNFAKANTKSRTPAFQSYGMAEYCIQYFTGEGLHVMEYEPRIK
jgi:hypothetical protein